MESLDLSYNNLSGAIPDSLEGLLYLQYFNASYNRLEGKIPSGGNFRNFTDLSFLNNYGLCGASNLKVHPCDRGSSNRSRSVAVLNYIIPLLVASVILVVLICILLRRRKEILEQLDCETSLLYAWKGSSTLNF